MPLSNSSRFFDEYDPSGKVSETSKFFYDPKVLGAVSLDIEPVLSEKIITIDDPFYDPITARDDACDTSAFKVDDRVYNRVTKGSNGALIECKNVEIPANSVLWFHYLFLPYESHRSNAFNSFSYFFAFNDTYLNDQGEFDIAKTRCVKSLGESLKVKDYNRSSLTWQVESWIPDEDFSGTLCWMVSSGSFADSGQIPMPAVLLLDSVQIA